MKRGRSILALALLALWAGVIHAQAFPTRPVTVVVAFPPGGVTDVISRILAQKLTEQLGKQVVVENRTGAAGNVAVICDHCDHDAAIQAILAGHSTSEIINVTVSGRIKRTYANESMWNPDGSYPLFYTISLDDIH